MDALLLRCSSLPLSPLHLKAVYELVTLCWHRQQRMYFSLCCNWLSSVPASALTTLPPTLSLFPMSASVSSLCCCLTALSLPLLIFSFFLFSFVLADIVSKPEEGFSYKQPSDQATALEHFGLFL